MHFFRLATRILDLAILGSGSTTFQTKISYIKYPKQDGIASCLDMIIILINSISSKNWPQYQKGWLLWTMRVLLDNKCLCSYVCRGIYNTRMLIFSPIHYFECWFFFPLLLFHLKGLGAGAKRRYDASASGGFSPCTEFLLNSKQNWLIFRAFFLIL